MTLCASAAMAQVDPALAKVIQETKAIDNHAHPLRYVAEGQKADDEYDALPCDTLEQAPGPARTRPGNPEWIGAWRALYGYKYNDMTPEHVKELVAAKQSAIHEHAAGYPAWVLDKAGIETMFANRVALGAGLEPPRFRWVPFVDALLLPLNNDRTKRLNSDFDWFYSHEEKLLKRYVADVHLEALPRSLRTYLAKVVTPTLERQKQEGAVALKLEAAYLRSLNFGRASEDEATGAFDRNVLGNEVGGAEYRRLQDYLFRYLAQEAGRLGLAIHIHSAPGCGDYFLQRGANPSLLETAFNDPSLRKTNFVIVHGGTPYTKLTAALLQKPNVYADISLMTLELYPRAFSEVLRDWLEAYPEKVLFGTDASPGPPEVNWEETAWLAAETARQALGMALTGMMNDGEIPRERAIEIARMVLRENAVKVYGLKTSGK
ncbi:MAG TPA: amidohydrolase family protein [Bryobacteraceae bacterium]|nr:amidohydrolase family protein [Bryobacteraceae bacterium]